MPQGPMHDSSIKDTLEVKNFGPIAEAQIDLRPLTVFIGPSNTGKSWLAILIYALHQHFSNPRKNRMPWHPMNRDTSIIESLIDWAQKTFRSDSNNIEDKIVLPDFVMDEIYKIRKIHVSEYEAKQLGDNILRCFGMDKKNSLIRKASRDGACINFERKSTVNSIRFSHELTIKSKLFSSKIYVPPEVELNFHDENNEIDIKNMYSMVDHMMPSYDKINQYHILKIFMDVLSDFTMYPILGPMYSRAFYLPASRTGIMHAHNTVVSAIIGNASMAAIDSTSSTSRLSGVLSDFLRALIQLDSPVSRDTPFRGKSQSYKRRQEKPWNDFDTKLEESILGGKIRMKQSNIIGYPHFTYSPQGWENELPLIYASSMVSEIAPVVLYLRHLVQPNDTLIIEEPEAHLHPAMQAEFTRQIVSFVDAGIRVVVTTHSEWVLETLANIVRRSDLSTSQRNGDLMLRPDQVGAWLFKQKRSPKGSVVEEIQFDPESGGLESDYGEVAEQLYNEWASIGNKIIEMAK